MGIGLGRGDAHGESRHFDHGVGASSADWHALRFFGLVILEMNSVLGVLSCVGEANISKKYVAVVVKRGLAVWVSKEMPWMNE